MMIQQEFDKDVEKHFNTFSDEYLDLKKREFEKESIVCFDAFLPEKLNIKLFEEARNLLSKEKKRRDLQIRVTGNSPRSYFSVNRDSIIDHGEVIPTFFSSEPILNLLSKMNGDERVYRIPFQPEEYIINSQQASGDTHGWHWDDYSFALIWMIDAPEQGNGGMVEYIPHTIWDKTDSENCIENILQTHFVRSAYIPKGSCYLMKANTTLHRVTPLLKNSKRTVVVFSYANEEDLSKVITHETAEEIYK
jgi:hypothetical protein